MNVCTFLKNNFPRCRFLPELNIILFKELLKAPFKEVKLKDSLGHTEPNILNSIILLRPAWLNLGSQDLDRNADRQPSLQTSGNTSKQGRGKNPSELNAIQHRLGLGAVERRATLPISSYISSIPNLPKGLQGAPTGSLGSASRTKLSTGYWGFPNGYP